MTDAPKPLPSPDGISETPRRSRPCPACRQAVTTRYCPDCGESPAAAEERSLRRFLLGWLEATTSLDGRFLGSFGVLLRRPGLLTSEYMLGIRKRRLSPMQLVLFANLIFFVAQSASNAAVLNTSYDNHLNSQIYSPLAQRLARDELLLRGIAQDEFKRRFDVCADEASRSLVLILVPLFALLFAVLRLPGRRGAVEHAAFAAEFVSFATSYVLCGLFGFYAVMVGASKQGLPDAVVGAAFNVMPFALFAIVAGWLTAAFRRLYGDRLPSAALRAGLACLGSIVPLSVYRFVLFLVALKTA